ncbi:protein ABHD18-like [Corticium candelabrum]|uniref:protein ABHD18-like n=1 Tax=Corticium candelabrum TaxID=121492 RepID=UPI002E2715AA|nr:protein ABHD18-like [Corticium candelabrum]
MVGADRVYRTFIPVKFFSKGWGRVETLERILRVQADTLRHSTDFMKRINVEYEVKIDKSHKGENIEILDGHFVSPLAVREPGLLPKESENAKFQVVLPKSWKSNRRSICLHLAGTGDHYFWRRRNLMAKPLAREKGIASILLENPYYGSRKPQNQLRSSLHHVSDIFVMGAALVAESAVLFNWCNQQGFELLGITGVSMGGHMASVASCFWPKAIAVVPCLSWSTASCVFTEGVFRDACAWPVLQEQLHVFEDGSLMKQLCKHSIHNNPDRLIESAVNKHDSRSLPAMISHDRKIKHRWRVPPLALSTMQNVMDTYTHLSNFPRPHPGSSVICVVAKEDRYIPRDHVTPLTDIWPDCEVRYTPGGHVTGYLFRQQTFRTAISDAFDRLALRV